MCGGCFRGVPVLHRAGPVRLMLPQILLPHISTSIAWGVCRLNEAIYIYTFRNDSARKMRNDETVLKNTTFQNIYHLLYAISEGLLSLFQDREIGAHFPVAYLLNTMKTKNQWPTKETVPRYRSNLEKVFLGWRWKFFPPKKI